MFFEKLPTRRLAGRRRYRRKILTATWLSRRHKRVLVGCRSTGRTTGSGPVDQGSNPCSPAMGRTTVAAKALLFINASPSSSWPRTTAFHAVGGGSNPPGDAKENQALTAQNAVGTISFPAPFPARRTKTTHLQAETGHNFFYTPTYNSLKNALQATLPQSRITGTKMVHEVSGE